jgi:predicted nucleotidyltransferase
MEVAIQQALHDIEQRGVRILYACEAGSRAWGIESKESDYDVRFIYVYPRDRYLSLDIPRDVIERPIVDDLDISGWDVFKALRLLRKSNPALLEWLFSTVIYREDSQVINDMRRIARSLIAPRVGLHYHYEHMARGNYRQYIKDKSPVLTKKYLYVVRPLVMLLYLDQHGSFPISVNFPSILTAVQLDDEVRSHIVDLVARKQAGDALGMAAPDPVLNAFIEERLEAWKSQEFSDSHDRVAMQRETANVLQAVLSEEDPLAIVTEWEISST